MKINGFSLFECLLIAIFYPPGKILNGVEGQVLRFKIRRILATDTQSAWDACCAIWQMRQSVMGGEVGPSLSTPFEHSLAESWGNYHPDSRKFLLERLKQKNALLAAYAFKCLTRFDISFHEIPAEALENEQVFQSLWFGCKAEEIVLRDYITPFFNLTREQKRKLGLGIL